MITWLQFVHPHQWLIFDWGMIHVFFVICSCHCLRASEIAMTLYHINTLYQTTMEIEVELQLWMYCIYSPWYLTPVFYRLLIHWCMYWTPILQCLLIYRYSYVDGETGLIISGGWDFSTPNFSTASVVLTKLSSYATMKGNHVSFWTAWRKRCFPVSRKPSMGCWPSTNTRRICSK